MPRSREDTKRTHINPNPNRPNSILSIPLDKPRLLRTLQIQLHLIHKRQHGIREGFHQFRVSRSAPGSEIVRVHRAGSVEFCDGVADPVGAAGGGVAGEGWVAEGVGGGGEGEKGREACLGVGVAAGG